MGLVGGGKMSGGVDRRKQACWRWRVERVQYLQRSVFYTSLLMKKTAPRSRSKIAFPLHGPRDYQMDSPPSSPTSLVVSSPRRTLSLLRERRVFTSDPEDKKSLEAVTTVTTTTGFTVEHGPKTSKVYGFVGSITTVIATGTFSPCPKHV
ncbi:Phosphatidylinositol N-acetylglucosaminyltransferase subunit P [Platanthera guangdongensis]|uniref:Phosphatidylinositol N-acetylglucosaminyltransferase subunit P n=1 Tax=Platanthera guangdongensis TaxID=2320717 RepID=A0ABR2LU58_9ASPA